MTAGERFRNWIDEVAQFWADRLGRWTGTAIGAGIDAFAKILGKSAAPKLKPFIDLIEKSGEVPPELKPLLDEMKDPTGEAAAIFSQAGGGAVLGGAIGQIIDALLRPIGYWMQRTAQNRLPDLALIMPFWLRGAIRDEDLEYFITSHGYPKGMVENFRDLAKIRLDANQVITAWRRDPEKYNALFSDLADQGWSPERIDALKFATLYYPGPTEVMTWAAREVFDPELRKKFQLDKFMPAEFKEWAEKAGITGEVADNYWASHWALPSISEVIELWRRKIWTKETVDDFWTELDMVPWVREDLFKLFRAVPTRVDVRRFWDMRTIDESRLRDIYQAMGYWEEDLEDYVLWTKVYVAFPDLIARWSKGWITLDEVKSQLTGLGMPAARVDEMIETKIKTAEPERTAGERDITKTDIIKGVKQGVITRSEGVELLIDMGYDEDEAVYILEINIPPDEEDVVVRQRELTKADILKGLKTEVITRDEARERLRDLRYPPADAEFLLKIYDAQVKPPVEPAAREASKADIIAAVKKGLITPEDAYLMLQDIDFTPEAAMFILEVKAEVSPFSPINYAEFKDRAQKYRRAAGMEIVEMPEEIKTAAAEVVRLTGEVKALEDSIEAESRGLVAEEIIPEATTKRLKGLQVKRNRAIATLEKAKSEYDRLVAEWRH